MIFHNNSQSIKILTENSEEKTSWLERRAFVFILSYPSLKFVVIMSTGLTIKNREFYINY